MEIRPATRGDGALWVAESDGRVAGTVGVAPRDDGAWEVERLCVAPSHRGRGLARRLLSVASAHARERGAERLEVSAAGRFEGAHGLLEKEGFVRAGGTHSPRDASGPVEHRWVRPFDACLVLDAAGARSAVRRLADILVGCVDAGASVSYLPPLDPAVAVAFWQDVADEVSAGRRVLIAGWAGGVLAGTVALEPASAPNSPHRAEVHKLLVHPSARRRGLATRLLACAEDEARRAGRTLLTLDTRTGDVAEELYRSLGWTEAGTIPGFAYRPDGTLAGTTFYWKRI